MLLFGVGQAETEGIYSLRAMTRDEGLPQDTIVAFEDLEDAERCETISYLSKGASHVHYGIVTCWRISQASQVGQKALTWW